MTLPASPERRAAEWVAALANDCAGVSADQYIEVVRVLACELREIADALDVIADGYEAAVLTVEPEPLRTATIIRFPSERRPLVF